MGLFLLLSELGGMVALLLWSIHMVQTGIQRTFGAKLKLFLGKTLHNRWKGFLAGLGVTTLLQSSTATGLMLTGFTTGGLVDLEPALAVMLGANVGTTLIVQLLSFNIEILAPLLILIGVVLFRKGLVELKDSGRIFIGLGLMLMALHNLVETLTKYNGLHPISSNVDLFSSHLLLTVIIAALITWVSHSSVAVILVIMSLATNGTIPIEMAFAAVLGANLGTAINPVLEGKSNNDLASKRLPVGNLINRVIGVGLALLLLPYFSPWFSSFEPNNARAVADFHTLFNLAVALLFFPFIPVFAKALKKLLPVKVDLSDKGLPVYLDPNLLEKPSLALAAANHEALRMAEVLESMLLEIRTSFEGANRRQVVGAKKLDDILDKLNGAIKMYLISINRELLSDSDQNRLQEIFKFVTELEHSGDLIDNNLLGIINKMIKRGLVFTTDEQAVLLAMVDKLILNTKTTASLFMTGDPDIARDLVSEKANFRLIENEATNTHFGHLNTNFGHLPLSQSVNLESSAMYIDCLRNLKSINSHLVAATAYPVLEKDDALLTTRLKD